MPLLIYHVYYVLRYIAGLYSAHLLVLGTGLGPVACPSCLTSNYNAETWKPSPAVAQHHRLFSLQPRNWLLDITTTASRRNGVIGQF